MVGERNLYRRKKRHVPRAYVPRAYVPLMRGENQSINENCSN